MLKTPGQTQSDTENEDRDVPPAAAAAAGAPPAGEAETRIILPLDLTSLHTTILSKHSALVEPVDFLKLYEADYESKKMRYDIEAATKTRMRNQENKAAKSFELAALSKTPFDFAAFKVLPSQHSPDISTMFAEKTYSAQDYNNYAAAAAAPASKESYVAEFLRPSNTPIEIEFLKPSPMTDLVSNMSQDIFGDPFCKAPIMDLFSKSSEVEPLALTASAADE